MIRNGKCQIKGKVVTPSGVCDSVVTVADGRIVDIGKASNKSGELYDFGDSLVLPGFINIHIHGLEEYSAEDKAGVTGMAKSAVKYGTTTFLPTGAAMSVEGYVRLGKEGRLARDEVAGSGAKIAGVHLEGPFINPESDGAMSLATRRPATIEEAKIYVEEIGDFLKVMTLSPELEGADEVIRYLRSKGVVAALGHTMASPEEVAGFVAAGVRHVVHFYNTFELSGYREQGVPAVGLLEAILTNEMLSCELICDLVHVEREYIEIAAKVLGPDRFVAITDGLVGAGFEEYESAFADGRVYKIIDGVFRTPDDGVLAGSALTMNKAFGNLVGKCGIDIVSAAGFTSLNASRVIGIDKETGSIEIGKAADVAVLDADYNCVATFVDGKIVYSA